MVELKAKVSLEDKTIRGAYNRRGLLKKGV